nr:phage tail tip lysozyme [uncultured Cohaesibacter sp.]
MTNRRARGLGKLAELNTQGQVSTKPGAAVDPNAGIWFTASASLRRAGQALGAMADRAMKRQQDAAVKSALKEGQQAGLDADLGTGDPNAEIGLRLMSDLQKDFGLSKAQAAGFVGNLAHESGGFETLQEVNPTVPGSRGGYGYAQWTGDRRKQFENFAKKNNLDPSSYEANYGFLKHELTDTKEGAFLDQLRQAQDAHASADIVSSRFLRPGIPNMDSRYKWADRFAGENAVAGTGRPSSSGPALALRRGDTPMGEAYWAARNRGIARRYPVEVTQRLDEIYEEHKDDPEALGHAFDEFQASSLAQLAKATNNDPDTLLLGQQTFAQKRRVYEKSARAAEDARVRDGERADYDENIGSAVNSLQRQAYQAANDEEAGASLGVSINENLASIEDALQAGVITPEVAKRDRRAILDTVTIGRIDGAFAALPDADAKEAFVEDLKEKWANGEEFLKDLSLEKVQYLEGKYQSAISKEKRAVTASAKLNEQKMRSMVNDDLASTKSTGVGLSIDGKGLTFDEVKSTLGPETAAKWQEQRRINAGIFNATTGLDVMSSSEMMAHLEGLEPKAGASGFVDQATIHDAAQKRARSILEQRREDPAQAVDEAFDDLAPLREQAYDGDPVAMESLIKGRLDAQEAIDIPDYAKAPLTNEEALALLAPLPDHPTRQEWLAEAAKWDRFYGPYADEVQKQLLHSKGVPKAILEEAHAYLKDQPIGNRPSLLQTKAADQKAAAVQSEEAMNGWAQRKVAEQRSYNQQADAASSARDHRGRKAEQALPPKVMWPGDVDITALRVNPDKAADFDAKFGEGAAEYYLQKAERDKSDLNAYLAAREQEPELSFDDWLQDQTPRQKTRQATDKPVNTRYQRRHNRKKD